IRTVKICNSGIAIFSPKLSIQPTRILVFLCKVQDIYSKNSWLSAVSSPFIPCSLFLSSLNTQLKK
ncbi:MAG: hypothetical protein JW841_16280, partial [Deltaproteobacteria bacterium]|nr:hypothetical protein [Deltaproteobacteria bacterium]